MSVLPHDEVMAALTKLAVEQATALIAAEARHFSTSLPREIGGREALAAFADSIEETNAKMYPKGPEV